MASIPGEEGGGAGESKTQLQIQATNGRQIWYNSCYFTLLTFYLGQILCRVLATLSKGTDCTGREGIKKLYLYLFVGL